MKQGTLEQATVLSTSQSTQTVVKCTQALMYFLSKIREYFLDFHANWIWKPIHIEPLRFIFL